MERSVKVKRYSEALDDLNAAIEADPTLSEAYFRRASILRQLCRLVGIVWFFTSNFKFSQDFKLFVLIPSCYSDDFKDCDLSKWLDQRMLGRDIIFVVCCFASC